MKVLVTGAGGFLGTHVVERLLAHGYKDIRCLLRDRSKEARLASIAQPYPDAQLEMCYGNLRSKSSCEQAVAGVSLIIHLAAGLKGAAADLFVDSVVASKTLLETLEARTDIALTSTRIVLVSSFGVYGVAAMKRGARVDESTPLEPRPELRDVYSFSKLRQEQLFWEYQRKDGFELVVLRPGVIYGPGGGTFSNRVGLQVGPVYLHLGGRNLLPLSYVANCAEAIAFTAGHSEASGHVYNVLDDDIPTAAQYLQQYKKQVKRIRSVRLPYFATRMLASFMESYNRRSQGQLPAILTRYKVAAAWGGNTFSNATLHALGWNQLISTPDAMQKTFEYFRTHPAKS